MDWQGQVAVVTGAANGIGRALAQALAARGARLVLADSDGGALERTAADLAAGGADVLPLRTDVSRMDQVQALADATLAHHGRVDLLVNNAGVAGGRRAWEYTEADWQWQLGVNLLGPAYAIRAFVPAMLRQGSGHVVNTASAAGFVSAPGMAAYNAGKHALVALSETLLHELQQQGSGVGVSVACPAWVDTGIWDSERYRPAQFRTGADGAAVPPMAHNPRFKEALQAGMRPEDVALQILDGVAERRFYILPSPRVAAAFVRRAERVRDGGAPFNPLAPQ